jgi:formate hydrogenlyase transcriptional activator
LRERRTDIRLLAEHILGRCSRRFGQSFAGFDAASLDALTTYDWPGNVRELQNVIERAAILGSGPELSVDASLLPGADRVAVSDVDDLDAAVRQHMQRVLVQCDWVIEGRRGAAGRLGLKPATLRYRMNKLGLRRPR